MPAALPTLSQQKWFGSQTGNHFSLAHFPNAHAAPRLHSSPLPSPLQTTHLLTHICIFALFHLQYNFLMQYDYLPKSDLETGALRTEEQLIDAIRNLQVGVPAKQMLLLPHVLCTISQLTFCHLPARNLATFQ